MKKNIQCKSCNSNKIVKLFNSTNTHGRHDIDNKEIFSVYRCDDCGAVFLTDLIINQAYYQKYYESGYYDVSQKVASNSFLNKILKKVRSFSFTRKLKIITSSHYSRGKSSILDIGCGSGEFLSSLNKEKFQLSGLEINPEGQKICRNKGIRIYRDEITKVDFAKEKFDIVTMWHVLEHIDDPNSLLQKISKILQKEGRLVIQTPSTDSLGFRLGRENWFHLDSPRHLILYNPTAINVLAKRNGFRVVKIINEFYDYPLDLFWSVRKRKDKILLRVLYPIFKIFSRENLTYILEKR